VALKDLQVISDQSSKYLVEKLDDGSQRITVTIDKNGKELGMVLRSSKKRGVVVSKVDPGSLSALAGILDGMLLCPLPSLLFNGKSKLIIPR